MPRGRARDQKSDFDVVFYLPWIGAAIASDEGPWPGGAETQVLLLAQALADRGLRVALISFPFEGLPRRLGEIEIIVRPDSRSKRRLIGKGLEVLAVFRTIGRLKMKVLVQRAAGFETGLAAVATKLKRRRFVYSSANIIDFEFERLEPRRRNVWLFEFGVRLADAIVVQTPEQRTLCEQRFKRKPVVIKSIAEQFERRTAQPEAFLWIARLSPYKNPLAFVDLAAALPEIPFRMVAVPRGNEAARLQAALDRAATELPNLEILPPQDRGELGTLIESAVAVVNTADYEGMPNIFLESWARGVPALSLTHDPDGVISREGLGEFADGSFPSFVQHAEQMWRTRHAQDDLAARCVNYVAREHSPETAAGKWIAALGANGAAAGSRTSA